MAQRGHELVAGRLREDLDGEAAVGADTADVRQRRVLALLVGPDDAVAGARQDHILDGHQGFHRVVLRRYDRRFLVQVLAAPDQQGTRRRARDDGMRRDAAREQFVLEGVRFPDALQALAEVHRCQYAVGAGRHEYLVADRAQPRDVVRVRLRRDGRTAVSAQASVPQRDATAVVADGKQAPRAQHRRHLVAAALRLPGLGAAVRVPAADRAVAEAGAEAAAPRDG